MSFLHTIKPSSMLFKIKLQYSFCFFIDNLNDSIELSILFKSIIFIKHLAVTILHSSILSLFIIGKFKSSNFVKISSNTLSP